MIICQYVGIQTQIRLAATLGSIHNLFFAVGLVARIRQSLLDGTYEVLKAKTLKDFYKEV